MKHGYWYFTEYEYFECSVCGETYYNGCDSIGEARYRLKMKVNLYRFCPHCGAKMDLEEQIMNEIEKAIQEFEDNLYHYSLHPEISDESKAVALAVLMEKNNTSNPKNKWEAERG